MSSLFGMISYLINPSLIFLEHVHSVPIVNVFVIKLRINVV